MINSELKAVKNLLLVLVVPFVIYLLKLLSFIFIPLVLAFFIALVLMPLMRWFISRKVPKTLSLIMVSLIIAATLFAGLQVLKYSSRELMQSENEVMHNVEEKFKVLVVPVEDYFGVVADNGEPRLFQIMKSPEFSSFVYKNFGSTLTALRKILSITLFTIFFLFLLLAGSLNMQKVMEDTIFKRHFSSVKTFVKIEKSIITFLKVKTLISLGTGISFGLLCWAFGVHFPVFWGLLAFALNYIQLLGSVISTALLGLFSLAEIDSTGTLLAFILAITTVQILFGSILEPIFMGKSFSINTITILVMLLLWGFIWGIPGLLLSVPITVFIKSILEQFPRTKVLANIMSGKN